MKKVKISKRRWLLLPVETKARELVAKTLLACVAAEKGWGAVVGNGKGIIRKNQELLPRGTFIEKSVSPTRKKAYATLRNIGNRVSAWCEEGLLYINADNYRERRIDLDCFRDLDYFFAWGKQQAEDIRDALAEMNRKVILSGNPRFDLLRPELRNIFAEKAREVNRRHGKIILVNTKFSTINNNRNATDFDYVAYLRSIGKIKTEEQEELWRRYVRLNKGVFPYFYQLMPVLSKEFPNHTIIVRPHPSESHASWIEKARDLPNVQVIFEGNVSEWLLAADIMIHNNCTTGVESFLLGRPSISYRPFKDESVEDKLPDQVSMQVDNEEDLIALVRRIIAGSYSISSEERGKQLEYARQYIANIEGNLACETIMETLNKLDLPVYEGLFPLGREKLSIKQKSKSMIGALRNIKSKKKLYSQQKFPGVSLSEMEYIIEQFRDVTGRFLDVQVVSVGKDTFCTYCPLA